MCGIGDWREAIRRQCARNFIIRLRRCRMRCWVAGRNSRRSRCERTLQPLSVLESLRGAVRGVTGDQVLYEVRTLEQLAAASLARQRFMMMVLGIFAALAMVLACIGIYGV